MTGVLRGSSFRYGELSLDRRILLVVGTDPVSVDVCDISHGRVVRLSPGYGKELLKMVHPEKPGEVVDTRLNSYFNRLLDLNVLDICERKLNANQIRLQGSSVKRLFIELTSGCNLSCPHCYGDYGAGKTKMLSIKALHRLFEQASQIGVCRVDLTGGEPLLHPAFCKIVDSLEELYMPYTVFSNLSIKSKDAMGKLIRYRPRYVTTSLESHDSSTHDSFRGVSGAHKITVNNIINLIECGVSVKVNLVVGKHNIKDVRETIGWIKSLGVSQVVIDTIRCEGRASRELCAQPTEIRALFSHLINECHKTKREISNVSRPCGVGDEMLYIDSEGQIRVCPSLSESNFIFGSIFDEAGGLSSAAANLKSRFGEFAKSTCRKECPVGWYCYGGCPVSSYKKMMNPSGPDIDVCERFFDESRG